ncbi:MAG: extracellular solute-binding protein [Clostridiales bacterium]|nr:extracellular solute-binding protein [Clostridiales bacterium]
MMKKMTILLLLVLLLCINSGCGWIRWNGHSQLGNTTDSTSDPGSVSSEPSGGENLGYPALDALPEADLEGVTLALTTHHKADFDDDSGDLYSVALSARTAAVQDKYHVGIAVVEKEPAAIYAELQDSIAKGEYFSDLVAIPLSWYGRFAADGLLAPLSDWSAVDLDKPYYADTDALYWQGAPYGVIGAASARAKYAYCVYFNEALAQEAKIDLYGMAADGNWTWDVFLSLLEGRYDAGVACASREELINCLFTSSGLSYTTLADGARYGSAVGEPTEGVIERAKRIFEEGAFADAENPAGFFAGGGCLFYIGTVSESYSLNDMPDSYGVLPLPCLAEGDEYASYVSGDMPVLCIPAGAAASEHAGLILEAYSAASYETIDNAYLSWQMAYCLRDNRSAQMIKRIGSSMKYDFAYLFGPHEPAVADATYGAVQSAVTGRKTHEELYQAAEADFLAFVGEP